MKEIIPALITEVSGRAKTKTKETLKQVIYFIINAFNLHFYLQLLSYILTLLRAFSE